jgi:hypothetical protein
MTDATPSEPLDGEYIKHVEAQEREQYARDMNEQYARDNPPPPRPEEVRAGDITQGEDDNEAPPMRILSKDEMKEMDCPLPPEEEAEMADEFQCPRCPNKLFNLTAYILRCDMCGYERDTSKSRPEDKPERSVEPLTDYWPKLSGYLCRECHSLMHLSDPGIAYCDCSNNSPFGRKWREMKERIEEQRAEIEAQKRDGRTDARVINTYRAEITSLRSQLTAKDEEIASRQVEMGSLRRRLAEAREENKILTMQKQGAEDARDKAFDVAKEVHGAEAAALRSQLGRAEINGACKILACMGYATGHAESWEELGEHALEQRDEELATLAALRKENKMLAAAGDVPAFNVGYEKAKNGKPYPEDECEEDDPEGQMIGWLWFHADDLRKAQAEAAEARDELNDARAIVARDAALRSRCEKLEEALDDACETIGHMLRHYDEEDDGVRAELAEYRSALAEPKPQCDETHAADETIIALADTETDE